jgi:hypothetical protein
MKGVNEWKTSSPGRATPGLRAVAVRNEPAVSGVLKARCAQSQLGHLD